MSRRLLIVTSSYRPTMIADMQRARMLAWELVDSGWETEILCPDKSFQPPAAVDCDSGPFFCSAAAVHDVAPRWPWLFSFVGAGTIGWRALIPIAVAGLRLLKRRRFDLVYFSTTQFNLFLLGPLWKKLRGVPYVLDFHDPCFREKAAASGGARSKLKRWLNNRILKLVESWSVGSALGIVSVSPKYMQDLRSRYDARQPAWSKEGRAAVIPFAASERDLDILARSPAREVQNGLSPRRVVYVGAGGPVMERAFKLLCRALSKALRDPADVSADIRFELFGTMLWWKEGDPRHLQAIADAAGVGGKVMESPARISYRRSLELQTAADGLLILGVDDHGYMPSKLFAVALTGAPILACLHRRSPGYQALASGMALAQALWFDETDETPMDEAVRVTRDFLRQVSEERRVDRRTQLAPYLAPVMADRHVDLFERCLQPLK